MLTKLVASISYKSDREQYAQDEFVVDVKELHKYKTGTVFSATPTQKVIAKKSSMVFEILYQDENQTVVLQTTSMFLPHISNPKLNEGHVKYIMVFKVGGQFLGELELD